ncbi:MAG: Hsp70 family protein [Peptococcaceae bacterium]|jgi:molecular chaperone DnaK|nr:Hsp70 family protein [Peptococcaceae bacterium]MDH7525840.1 Hsp70 family protein [Peptococcaceae bacterium]
MSIIVGIDLGTSTSEIAVLKEGKPLVISNHLGEYITPSVVGLSSDGRIIVGKEARDQLLLKPEDTVIEVKRLMGSGATVSMGGKEYTPQQISSYILSYLIECARKYLGEDVDRAVITVPAYFSDTQRRATVEAGKLAGIQVERIINEPTAAALDFGLEHMKECQNILVYDLGGGTLDVTVLEMFEGVLDVKASSGNNQLGGKDFDQRLMDYLLERFTAQYGVDVSEDKRALMRLKEAVEKCKIDLSEYQEHHLLIPFFANAKGNPVSLEETVSRETFEGLIKEMIDSTAKQIYTALADARLSAADIDLILLVGGSTRIPYVRCFIENTLGKSPQPLIDPDLAVVRGAAVQAGLLNNQLSAEKDILITDVCPYTLGTSILSYVGGFPVTDVYDVIIPRNVTIPVVKEKIYGTVADNQTAVEINVYQGEYKKASYNNFLGKFLLKGIPPAPALQEKISVTFSYDVNGILQVEGKIVSTGKKANLVIETTGVEMVQEIEPEGWEKAPNAKKYRAIIKKAGRLVENGQAQFYAPEIESLIRKIKTGLVQGEKPEKLDAYKEELHEIIYELTEEMNV